MLSTVRYLFLLFGSHSKKADSSSEYELTQRVEISGAVESLTFAKVPCSQCINPVEPEVVAMHILILSLSLVLRMNKSMNFRLKYTHALYRGCLEKCPLYVVHTFSYIHCRIFVALIHCCSYCRGRMCLWWERGITTTSSVLTSPLARPQR